MGTTLTSACSLPTHPHPNANLNLNPCACTAAHIYARMVRNTIRVFAVTMLPWCVKGAVHHASRVQVGVSARSCVHYPAYRRDQDVQAWHPRFQATMAPACVHICMYILYILYIHVYIYTGIHAFRVYTHACMLVSVRACVRAGLRGYRICAPSRRCEFRAF